MSSKSRFYRGKQFYWLIKDIYTKVGMILEEKVEDYEEVQKLTRQAFWNLYEEGANEHYLLHRMRQSSSFIPELSLVYRIGEQIVGHIAYTHSKVKYPDSTELQTITFGPVSILPSYHRNGIGSILVKQSIARAKNLGYKCIIIMGHPHFYYRFGFQSSKIGNFTNSDGIFYRGTMFLELQNNYLKKQLEGIFEQSDCFNIGNEQALQFDSIFPPKEKYPTLSQKMFQIFSQLKEQDEMPQVDAADLWNRQRI